MSGKMIFALALIVVILGISVWVNEQTKEKPFVANNYNMSR